MKENSLPFAKSVYIAENLCLPEQHFVHYVNYIMSLIVKKRKQRTKFSHCERAEVLYEFITFYVYFKTFCCHFD